MKLELKVEDGNDNPSVYTKFYYTKIYDLDSNNNICLIYINYLELTKAVGEETTLMVRPSPEKDFNEFIFKLKELGFKYVSCIHGYIIELNSITYEEFKIFSQNILDLFKELLGSE